MSRLKGKVKWFNKKKGFGILIYDNEEFYIHHSEIKSTSKNIKELFENELVEFEIGIGNNNKSIAKNITGLSKNLFYFETNNYLNEKKKYIECFKNTAFFLIAFSGIIQAIRSIILEDGKLSFWSQLFVISSSFFQIIYFYTQSNWQFIIIQIGIIILTIINIYSIIISGDEYIKKW
tara:strand:+ start:784 stop:1314 length:531 start_codon:yes stop_codon:yes gene_type:complete